MLKHPSRLLRLEGFVLFAASLVSYHQLHGHWTWFLALFLVPDLTFAGYWFNVRIGAAIYNLFHTLALPLAGAIAALLMQRTDLLPYLLIWSAHIGMDRMLGFGLKYPTHFNDTHLQRTDVVSRVDLR